MTFEQAMARLESLGSDKVKKLNIRNGAGGDQFGVKLGDIRNLAKEIKSDHTLALQLWDSGNLDARLLGLLVMTPKQISAEQLDEMVKDAGNDQTADWLMTNIVKNHPAAEGFREQWMADPNPYARRAGWSLTTRGVAKLTDPGALTALLDRIEREAPTAPAPAQWTMNYCLAEIGITSPEHRDRAIALGEQLGMFRDYPVSKGCVSPYAPIWIAEMVRRKS
ncbi:MAG: DNA alkylation repair protein [Armatimonadetes bacterium]|nr:DNA alkylation repair protein [Armatimonadota bacterium]MBX3108814.1 DNA alkylation repair protein [Fimbriimonadaceae bacterium]